MNIFILYLLSASMNVPFSESSRPQFYLHRIANAMAKMRSPLEMSIACGSDTDCIKTEKCVNGYCRDPCPGSCGIDANCNVVNHAMSCLCPECYSGDPYEKCRSYRGLRNAMCQFRRIIRRLSGL